MNTESDLDWLPYAGHRLHKVGVEFDVVRVTGDLGRRAADLLDSLLAGDCGPVIEEVSGGGHVYFLCPPGSTGGRAWPAHALRLGGPGTTAYVGVPALMGRTWPLTWRYRPPVDGTWCHPVMLHSILCAQAPQPADAPGDAGPDPAPDAHPDDGPDDRDDRPDDEPDGGPAPARHPVPPPPEPPDAPGDPEGPETLADGWGMVV
jgi:hypothetical protein